MMCTSTMDSYLCPYCSTRLDTFELMKAHVVAEHSTEPLPLPEGIIRITINKQDYQLHVEPEWTLYYLLHDRLGLLGIKMFCDRGEIGRAHV